MWLSQAFGTNTIDFNLKSESVSFTDKELIKI